MFIPKINPLFCSNKADNHYKTGVVKAEKMSFRQPLLCDVVSFQGKKVDLLQKPKEKIFEILKESMKPKNKIGEGVDAEVFKIKDTDYCIRRPFFSKGFESDFSLDIGIKDKINHVVANLGGGCRIMNIIKGRPIATCDETLESMEYTEDLIEQFPIESFNQLIKQITFAYKNDMVFDNHWANIIINPEEQTLTAIDFYDKKTTAFLDILFADPLSAIFSSVVNVATTLPQMSICAKKILKAGLQELKPNYQPYISPEEFDFNPMLEWLRFNKKIDVSQENCELLKQSFNSVIELKNEELKGKSVKKRLTVEIEKANELTDKFI